jgi:decaprenylphospho-beta-D-erythro-pentofuranosid-2-ulose 2-reductase
MKILILGVTSAIAQETARCFAGDGSRPEFFLVGRDAQRLETIASDLKVHGASRAETHSADLSNLADHEAIVQMAIHALGNLDAVLIAHGTLTDQKRAEQDMTYLLSELNLNFTSYVSLLTHLANYFETRKRGTIAVISSVAGDRGRGSNYAYGAAKAGVTAFVGGLRARMAKVGVNVVTIKPGFVDSPMTAHLKKNPLYASAGAVGNRIYVAMTKGENIVYVPAFWALIMMIIRNVPERIFKKTKL